MEERAKNAQDSWSAAIAEPAKTLPLPGEEYKVQNYCIREHFTLRENESEC